MVHRLLVLGLVVLAIVASACAAHQPRMHVAPLEPSANGPQFNPSPFPIIRTCWDTILRTTRFGVSYGEWYDNSGSNTPTLFIITESPTGREICSGVVNPGGRRFGPAIWAQKADKTEWLVTGTSYITVVNSDRTEGVVDTSPVRLEYVYDPIRRVGGWFTRCPC